MSKVMFCADSTSIKYPECLGLAGEGFGALEWLDVLSSAHDARARMGDASLREVWVAGSDEVDAINLAAALKQEGTPVKVCLIAFQGSGSMRSRAQSAGIDEVWDKHAFLARYSTVKAALGTSRNRPEGIAVENAREPIEVAVVPTSRPEASQNREQAETVDSIEQSGADTLRLTSAHVPDPAAPQQKHGAASSGSGFLVSVVGAGGGVGKSSVSVVAAYLAQSMGYKTALIDADLQFGDVPYLTGRSDVLLLDEVAESPERIDAASSQGRSPAILAAPAHLERSELVESHLADIVARVRHRFDVVVVNTSPTWSDFHLQLLEAGGAVLFLLDQRPSSIRACKHAVELCARCGVATRPIVFALNRCSRQSLFSSIDVSCALQGAHVVELADGGRDVEELLGTGEPIELIDSGNALCQSVARVLADLLPGNEDAQRAFGSYISERRRFGFRPKRKKA